MFWRKALIYKETVVIGLLIAYLSLVKEPAFRLPDTVAFADKWGHVLAYILLGGMLLWNLVKDNVAKPLLWIIALTIPILYGGVLELIQGLYCYPRTASWWDWLADIAGTIVGVCLVAGVWKWKH